MASRYASFVHKHVSRSVTRASYSTAQPAHLIRQNLRALLRETAQPVAVVTSLMPLDCETPAQKCAHFHGATLSSFSSIALDPHPLVAFSLRIPSRMAASLKSARTTLPAASHMVVNILSAAQVPTAVRFSRPDLHPDPFAATPFVLSAEGLPVLEGSLGALSCKLIAASWPLHDLEVLEGRSNAESVWDGEGVASELFIARVTRVETLPASAANEDGHERQLRTSPLLYYRRAYSTTCDIPGKPSPEPEP